MFRKLLLFLFIPLALIPLSDVRATQVYVGVQLAAVTAPGCTDSDYSNCPGTSPAADNHWCFPGGKNQTGTQLAIATDNSCSYSGNSSISSHDVCQYYCPGLCVPLVNSFPTSYVAYSNYPTCINGTIWSGLVDIANGNSYHAYLYAPGFCPGYINGYCWVSDAVNENCCDICSHYGLTASGGESSCSANNNCDTSSSVYDDSNCNNEAALMGFPCTGGCHTGQTLNYFNSSTKECWTNYGGSSNKASCSALPATGAKRVCACNYPGGSSFFFNAFTASF